MSTTRHRAIEHRIPEHRAPEHKSPEPEIQTLKVDGQPTHVVLPIEDYRKLSNKVRDPLVREALTTLSDGRTQWHDADEVLRECSVRQIAAARKQRGMTQAQLGKVLGIPQSQVSRLEHHPQRTSAAMLEKVARALGVRLVISG